MNIPKHVGIIMDGNGRWAKERGLSRSMGHKEGCTNLGHLLEHVFKKGIQYFSVYAFSTENFKRSKEEVDYLMNLMITYFNKEEPKFVKNKIRVVFSGSRENLSPEILEMIDKVTEDTKDFKDHVFNICFNYGGRLEIVDATKKIGEKLLSGKLKLEDINEEMFDHYMYQDLPPLDYVIRTSGEMRTSNFMLWESSYAEYYFPKTYFPDFNNDEFDKALEEYDKRNRRFGGV